MVLFAVGLVVVGVLKAVGLVVVVVVVVVGVLDSRTSGMTSV